MRRNRSSPIPDLPYRVAQAGHDATNERILSSSFDESPWLSGIQNKKAPEPGLQAVAQVPRFVFSSSMAFRL
jgi:hypothetical protein